MNERSFCAASDHFLAAGVGIETQDSSDVVVDEGVWLRLQIASTDRLVLLRQILADEGQRNASLRKIIY
jgi:hypothetical protein